MEFLVKIAKQAERYTKKTGKIVEKKVNDYVTDADLAVEKFLIKKIREKYPTHDIVSEETRNDESSSKNYFTIDPIDGTNNFAVGIPLWAIQIAKVDDGKIVASVVFVPNTKECFCAAHGQGAFLNGQKLPMTKNAFHVIMTGNAKKEEQKTLFANITKTFSIRDFGACSLALAYLAAGRGKCVAGLFSAYRIWDILPGKLLIEEVGGKIFEKNEEDAYYFLAANSEQDLQDLVNRAKK